jgi:Uma2 family endonuclease
MTVALLEEVPLVPPVEVGPFRRRDYDRVPEDVRCELLDGWLYVCPSPTLRHQALAMLLAEALQRAAERAGGWVFVAPLDVALAPHSIVQPDVLYLSAGNGQIAGDRIDGAPELVIEVLSPGTVRRDRMQKLRLYARSGVREYWLADPIERQIEFLQNDHGRFVVGLPEAGSYSSPVLSGLDLDLVALWRELERRLPPQP